MSPTDFETDFNVSKSITLSFELHAKEKINFFKQTEGRIILFHAVGIFAKVSDLSHLRIKYGNY